MFICGSGSFANQEDDDNDIYNSPYTTTKRTKKSTSFCKIICRDNGNKNPYSDRGLDKFNALLADLDNKRQQIYTQKGSNDISFVQFVYPSDDPKQLKPIIIRVKKNNKRTRKTFTHQDTITRLGVPSTGTVSAVTKDVTRTVSNTSKGMQLPEKKAESGNQNGTNKRYLRCNGSFKLHELRPHQYYFVVVIVMILFLLAIYGRSFAIICVSIGWYLVPSMEGSSTSALASPSKKKPIPKIKKDYVKIMSEKKIVHSDQGRPSSPTSVLTYTNKVQEHG